MEKYTQYRDRGTGIAPFLPLSSSIGPLQFPFALVLFILRLPFLITIGVGYFVLLQFLPLGTLLRKGLLWCILILCGVWWVDLQVEGVKRGTLARNLKRLPSPGSVIAATFSCPLDALYLAATFDPVFAIPYPGSSQVRHVSLWQAIRHSLMSPSTTSVNKKQSTTIAALVAEYPHRIIAVFPEGTTTNGKALLRFAPCLTPLLFHTEGSKGISVFPISMRYSPPSITTPIPVNYISFLWRLLGEPTHTIKVRIGEAVVSSASGISKALIDGLGSSSSSETITETTMLREKEANGGSGTKEAALLDDKVAEALARIGRVRRVGLGVKEKVGFWEAWKASKSGVRKRS